MSVITSIDRLGILVHDLRGVLTGPFDPDDRRRLVRIVDKLLELFGELDCGEGGEECFAAVVEKYPSWDVELARLWEDEESLCRSLRGIRQKLKAEPTPRRLLRKRLRSWLNSLERHRERRVLIFQAAMSLDMGCGD